MLLHAETPQLPPGSAWGPQAQPRAGRPGFGIDLCWGPLGKLDSPLWSAASDRWPCLYSTHLDEVPALVQAALDLVAVQELGQPTLRVIHQAAGVREECGGPQGAQVQEAFLGVAGKLSRDQSSRRMGVRGRSETMGRSGAQVGRCHPCCLSILQSWPPSQPVTHTVCSAHRKALFQKASRAS